jgi:hypothetical protein
MERIELERVHYMPMELSPGILYVSEEFNVAGHLCPCGCGNKIITPLTPTEWSFAVDEGKPSLYPSIGNWQLPCRSHYWIIAGEIEWSHQWTDKQIKAGRMAEEKRRRSYYENINSKHEKGSFFKRVSSWFKQKTK